LEGEKEVNYKELMLLEDKITISDYDLMLHAIGFQRNRVHRYKFRTHRNYFAENIDSTASWDKLFELGVADIMEQKECMIFYKLTNLGIQFIEAREGCKVLFEN